MSGERVAGVGGEGADGASLRRFEGRVVIVTGASREPSIGRATARRVGREGASVVLNAREAGPLAEAERALAEEGVPVVAVRGSMEDEGTAARLVEAAHASFGRLDGLVNTVGGNRFLGSPRTMSRAELMETVELNVWGPVALVQRAVAAGLGAGSAVVNVSSGTVRKTTPKMIAYAAGKAALDAITRTLARDLAPLGVRVNAVAPGFTRTDGTRSMWEPDDGAVAARNLPLGRLTGADDIAAACAFLLSGDAMQITGCVLDVDGGNHLQGGGWTPMTDPTIQGRSG